MIRFLKSDGSSEKTIFKHMLVTAAVAGFFFVLFVIFCGITPAGDSTWSVFDMKMQYLDFYSYYKSVLEGKNDLTEDGRGDHPHGGFREDL